MFSIFYIGPMYIIIIIKFCGSLPKHSSFKPPQKLFFPSQGSDLSSLGRFILKKQGVVVVVVSPPKVAVAYQTIDSLDPPRNFTCPN